ncbi:hypothetical protein COCON_G00233550 [Conger conger]|uniref:Ig-like domain-containing protein n=1 Tax=Conger conger TaxID=82655 RepID=A0A9Q1CUK1_CONCO|nr:hypothetical protein COCON_G00233550 [Conger conger]
MGVPSFTAVLVLVLVITEALQPGMSQEHPPALLTIQPNSRQHFRLDQMSLWCPSQEGSSSEWTLKHLSRSGVQSGCLPAGGSVSTERPGACLISSLFSGNSGLYWCESGAGGVRTSSINITVVYGPMIIQCPAQPVAEGDWVILRCHYWRRRGNATAFYKDGVLLSNGTAMTIRNVTRADQGLYMCADSDGTASPESWLSVESVSPTELQLPSTFPTDAPSPAGSWLMVVVPCCIVGVFLIVTLSLLAHHRRSPLKCSPWSCCATGGTPREGPKRAGPQTQGDVTEIQWDLPWLEMEDTLLHRSPDEEQGA